MAPNLPRCTRMKAWFPTIRPTTPRSVATPNMVTRATVVRADVEWTWRTVTDANTAPRRRPHTNPP